MIISGLRIEKVMKTTIRHWAFAIIAWASFIISFFLPAFGKIPGWKAAIIASSSWQQAMHGNLLAIHFLLLTFANPLILVSPFFLAGGARDVRFVKCLRGLSLAATVLVWLFLAWPLAAHMGDELGIGYYLWASSFLFLSVASFLQPNPSRPAAVQTT